MKVTNTKNNKSVVVRVDDRGPTEAGRVVDLSMRPPRNRHRQEEPLGQLEVVSEPLPKKTAK